MPVRNKKEFKMTKPFKMVMRAVMKDDQGRYLMMKRSADSKIFPGVWEFPGGKIEPSERPLDALRREIWEELGYDIPPVTPFGIYSTEVFDKAIELHAFIGEADEQITPKLIDHDAYGWFDADELVSLNVPDPDKPIIKLLISGKNQ